MAKTLGDILNAALKEIREPEITALTSGYILQEKLVEAVNEASRHLRGQNRYAWSYNHTGLQSVAKITTGTAGVTNASTTVTSKDDAGANADNFGSVSTAMWFRATGDNTSHAISSIDTASSPDTLTLALAFQGTTSTSVGYRLFQDTYALSDTDLDEIQAITYGDGTGAYQSLFGVLPDFRLQQVPFEQLLNLSGGDLHRPETGKPRCFARFGTDASNNPRFVFWPYPDSVYTFDVWYTVKYTAATALATTLLGSDAPELAYDAIQARVKSQACMWDDDTQQASYWEGQYRNLLGLLNRRQNHESIDNSLQMAPLRRNYNWSIRGRSGLAFDTKSARR